MRHLTMEQEALEYRSMGLGSAASHPPRTPRACLRCDHTCHYYGIPEYAAGCQRDLDDADRAQTELDAVRS